MVLGSCRIYFILFVDNYVNLKEFSKAGGLWKFQAK